MSKYDKGYEVGYRVNGQSLSEVVYAPNRRMAMDLIQTKYGSEATNVGIDRELKSQFEQEREREAEQSDLERKQAELQRQQVEQAKAIEKKQSEQEKRLQELEIKTLNTTYQQQANELKNEVENILPSIEEWEQAKRALEDEINSIIAEVRKKRDNFSEYSLKIQKTISTINTKIDEHNSQEDIYKSNKVDPLKNLDDTLNTEIDFSEKTDGDLGFGGWIFIIFIIGLIFYGIDWFFDLNIYSGTYEFLKNLFGSKA